MTDQNNLSPFNITTDSRIQSVVMRRVRTIRLLRPLFSAMAVSLVAFAAALWGIGREVWVARVFQNAPSLTSLTNIQAFVRFCLAAFFDTRFIVQVLSVLTIAALVWLMYNTARILRETPSLSFG